MWFKMPEGKYFNNIRSMASYFLDVKPTNLTVKFNKAFLKMKRLYYSGKYSLVIGPEDSDNGKFWLVTNQDGTTETKWKDGFLDDPKMMLCLRFEHPRNIYPGDGVSYKEGCDYYNNDPQFKGIVIEVEHYKMLNPASSSSITVRITAGNNAGKEEKYPYWNYHNIFNVDSK